MAKTCLDCSAYLPVPLGELTEFGICLNEEALEPFVEEILVGSAPGSCQALLEEKKFEGDRPACPDFQESEILEIDDDSPLGQEVRRLEKRGELTPETFEAAIFKERVRQIDWNTLPVDPYARQLDSNSSNERDAGISSLGGMIALGNPAAFQALLRLLSSLPPPAAIEEVHRKKEILRHLDGWRDKSAVVPILIEELGRTASNNTTRQWIAQILEFLEGSPLEAIEGPLTRMLAEKKFSPGVRKKIAQILCRS